ncbi:uncharacterized protein MELLADRAFT_76315 [Melampsora larici-populina 98AG31]|uniref:Late embryogenesis abundant protein LEA-2 subgroup domain-containing protein n=1 Tax=Melampsora larici-populina (strain 98AG31 / pathotype 3-4-7) TaxID=747676 RepID=F4R3X8_MELLP|nr:uncharacterized protein MELLADRAFT_76315 [Melampsora larici-populina 98AG31]EGG12700.1 hypothetical protein MELLADRAFT_76315 [Melampsora larici-populina 98AG31]
MGCHEHQIEPNELSIIHFTLTPFINFKPTFKLTINLIKLIIIIIMAYDPRDRYPNHQQQPPPPDSHYYQSYDQYQEPSQLPYGPTTDHQLPYTSSQPSHQQPYVESHSPYPTSQDHQEAYHHQDQQAYHHQDHLNYPPGSMDPYYSHQDAPPSPQPAYYNQYDDHQSSGYPIDEKSDYPPPHTAQHLVPNPKSSFNQNSRGSVAAQMAAEGAIPEKAGLRMWRSDEHSGAFLRGVALLLIGIVAGFLLWVRPPNATFNGIEPPTAGNQVDLQEGGFLLNFDLNIGVTNPNFFGASFSKISAKAYYPLNKTAPLGGGEMDNVQIQSHSNTTIHFPFQINYTTAFDPKHAILADIAYKCGFLVLGGQQSMEALQEMLTGTNASRKLKRSLEEDQAANEMALKSIGIGFFHWDLEELFGLDLDGFESHQVGWNGFREKVLVGFRRR